MNINFQVIYDQTSKLFQKLSQAGAKATRVEELKAVIEEYISFSSKMSIHPEYKSAENKFLLEFNLSLVNAFCKLLDNEISAYLASSIGVQKYSTAIEVIFGKRNELLSIIENYPPIVEQFEKTSAELVSRACLKLLDKKVFSFAYPLIVKEKNKISLLLNNHWSIKDNFETRFDKYILQKLINELESELISLAMYNFSEKLQKRDELISYITSNIPSIKEIFQNKSDELISQAYIDLFKKITYTLYDFKKIWGQKLQFTLKLEKYGAGIKNKFEIQFNEWMAQFFIKSLEDKLRNAIFSQYIASMLEERGRWLSTIEKEYQESFKIISTKEIAQLLSNSFKDSISKSPLDFMGMSEVMNEWATNITEPEVKEAFLQYSTYAIADIMINNEKKLTEEKIKPSDKQETNIFTR